MDDDDRNTDADSLEILENQLRAFKDIFNKHRTSITERVERLEDRPRRVKATRIAMKNVLPPGVPGFETYLSQKRKTRSRKGSKKGKRSKKGKQSKRRSRRT